MQIARWIFLSILCFTELSAVTTISSISAGGMTISSPGLYVFGNDITWSPTGAGQAILITASGVTLDMQNFTLQSTTTAFNTTGISAIGASNLIIKNGTIANMGLQGISCDLCLSPFIYNITVDGLNANDIATYTVPTGILVTASGNAIVANCTVKNLDVTTGSLAAIQFTGTIGSLVSNCTVLNLLNRDGACTGIGHLLCDTAIVESCTLNYLTAQFGSNLNTEGHTAIGIIPVFSTNLVIRDCTVSNVTGCCDDAHGMSVFECSNAVVKNCKVNTVIDGVTGTQTGAKATGIEIYASNTKVIKCSAKNITAINPQDKQATGFSCAQSTGVKFIKCYAENVVVVDQNGNQNSSLGYGTGFGWAPDPRPDFLKPAIDVQYKHCTAKNCQVGFDSWFHINSSWKHIHSICNGIAVLDLNDSSQRTLSCDACSECGCTQSGCYPSPITVTITNVASNNTFSHVHEKYCNN